MLGADDNDDNNDQDKDDCFVRDRDGDRDGDGDGEINFNSVMFQKLYGLTLHWISSLHHQKHGWISWQAQWKSTDFCPWVSMGAPQKREESQDDISGTLTTRFAYDWRVRSYPTKGQMWMRRSRFVAREFANDKYHDTYSRATGPHTSNLILILYLKMLSEREVGQMMVHTMSYLLLSIKHAFLQVLQVLQVLQAHNPPHLPEQ
eukprot:s4482_g3.t1